MIDFKLKKESLDSLVWQDLEIVDSDLNLLYEKEELQQNVSIMLQFYKGEWFLDVDAGVPYFEKVFVKGVEMSVVDSVVKSSILENKDILKITEFSSSQKDRFYSCRFRADTTEGEVEFSVEEMKI